MFRKHSTHFICSSATVSAPRQTSQHKQASPRRILVKKIQAQMDYYAHLRAQYEDRQIYADGLERKRH